MTSLASPLHDDIFRTPEFKELSNNIGFPEAVWLMWTFAKLESNFSNAKATSSSAQGYWQITNGTRKGLLKNHPSLPASFETQVDQSRYAAQLIIDLVKRANKLMAENRTLPCIDRLSPRRDKLHMLLSLVRSMYHLGPSGDIERSRGNRTFEAVAKEFVTSMKHFDDIYLKTPRA